MLDEMGFVGFPTKFLYLTNFWKLLSCVSRLNLGLRKGTGRSNLGTGRETRVEIGDRRRG